MLEESIRRIDGFRAAHPEHTIVDVPYADLVRDPVTTVERIYAAAGDALGEDARRAMHAYVAAHPKGGLGEHHYDLAEFGLERGALAERFAGYVDRYGVEQELGAT